jgi:superfamily II DNA or RNA helicase
VGGAEVNRILAQVTPGGGKSALPIIAAHRMIGAGLADAICWICPRRSLQHQGEINFQDPMFRAMIGHRLSIRSSTNDPDPCRGLAGFVTTYQALGCDTEKTVLADFRRKRYVLVLDEFHHAQEESKWHLAIDPLVESSVLTLLMTGTLERGNGQPIAWIPYRSGQPDIGSSDLRVISYSREDALAERAIIPLHFFFYDGSVRWADPNAIDEVAYNSLSEVPLQDLSKAIYTAVSAGIDYKDALAFVSEAEKLSVAGKADLEATTKALVSTLNAYGASVAEARTVAVNLFIMFEMF